MKRLFSFILVVSSFSLLASSSKNEVLVSYKGEEVDVLDLSNLQNDKINAFLNLKSGCFNGDQLEVVDALNDIFNYLERNNTASKWLVSFSQATTPNIPEQKNGNEMSVGIEYEDKTKDYRVVRFLIQPCQF